MLHLSLSGSLIVNHDLCLYQRDINPMSNCHLRYCYKIATFIIAMFYLSISSSAQAVTNYSDDDTILIEKELSHKISYSTALKTFAKHILKFDIDSALSGGKNCREAVIRSFSDFSDRTKYRLNLKHDKVEVKFSLNF